MDKQPFWMGVLVGAGVTLAAVVGVAHGARSTGVTITVDRKLMERELAQEVERSVQRELPALLAQVQRDAPSKIASAVRQRLDAMTIDIGWGAVRLPDPLRAQVESGVTDAVTAGLKAGLEVVPTDQIAQRVAAVAPQVVDRLTDGLGAQRIQVQIAGLSIPLRIRAN
jgi:hypothetical protein